MQDELVTNFIAALLREGVDQTTIEQAAASPSRFHNPFTRRFAENTVSTLRDAETASQR